MSTATAVTAADFASELWASVNVEITIFAVTLAVAMAMRMLTRPSTVGKRAKKVVEGGCSPAGKVERQPSDGFARQRRSPTAGQAPQQSPAAAQPRPCPAAPLQGGALAPAQILNEVVSSVGESKSLKAASRALGLFVRMQQTMAAPGAPSMAKVAQGSQHSALDFYTTVLQCAVRIGRFDLLDTIIDDMVHHDVQRSLGFYELAMKQLAAQKQYSAALKIYDRLSADGLRPSHVTYSCLIGFAAEVGELKRAVELLRQALRRHHAFHSRLHDHAASLRQAAGPGLARVARALPGDAEARRQAGRAGGQLRARDGHRGRPGGGRLGAVGGHRGRCRVPAALGRRVLQHRHQGLRPAGR
ncbi:unnamed protein product, partial [Prorocentrum cordatum]